MSESKPKKWLTLALPILLGVYFMLAAFPKVSGDPGMVGAFEQWGYSSRFLLLIGVLEALGGILLLFPRFAFYGGGMLIAVMGGAIYTHISTGIGSPVLPIIVLVLLAVAAFLRKPDALGLSS